MLNKTAAPPAPTPLTLAVAPVLPEDETPRRLDAEPGLGDDLEARRIDPYAAVAMLVERVRGGGSRG